MQQDIEVQLTLAATGISFPFSVQGFKSPLIGGESHV